MFTVSYSLEFCNEQHSARGGTIHYFYGRRGAPSKLAVRRKSSKNASGCWCHGIAQTRIIESTHQYKRSATAQKNEQRANHKYNSADKCQSRARCSCASNHATSSRAIACTCRNADNSSACVCGRLVCICKTIRCAACGGSWFGCGIYLVSSKKVAKASTARRAQVLHLARPVRFRFRDATARVMSPTVYEKD